MSQPRALLASPWFLGALLLAIATLGLDLAALRAGVPHPLDDSWEDAIVARSLLQGHGFRSLMIYPPLWALRDPATLTVPVLVHGPLVPLLLAPLLVLGGPAVVDHVAWLAALFLVLTLFPLFRLTARHLGEPVAAGAASLFALSPLALAAVNHYLTVLVGAFLLTSAIDLLARERPRAGWAGALMGLCSLARPEALLAIPVLAFLAASGPSRARAAWMFLLGCAAAASWWWWVRWRASGSPFFNLSSYLLVCFSPSHPGDGLMRDFSVPPDRFPEVFRGALPGLWRKWAHFFPRAVKRALVTPGEATGWLAVVGAAAALSRRRFTRTALHLGWVALVPVVAITLVASVRLYPVPFAPLYCMAAALGAKELFERLPAWARRPRAWLSMLLALALPSAAIEIKEQAAQARSIERWLAADRAELVAATRSPGGHRRLMFSDTPDFVAWTTARPTVWLTREEFDRLFGSGGAPTFRPEDLPPRPWPEDTWFHSGDPRDPAGQKGRRIGP